MSKLNYDAIIERIVTFHQDKLSEWEIGFIDTVYRYNNKENLSDRQKEIIRKINKKCLSG